MGEVISIQEYLERKAGPTKEDIKKRLAQIGLEQLLLASEKVRLQNQLLGEETQ